MIYKMQLSITHSLVLTKRYESNFHKPLESIVFNSKNSALNPVVCLTVSNHLLILYIDA